MYSRHYDSVVTSGPVRRVEVPYRTHELYPSSHTASHSRQSHSYGKRSRKEDRSKSRKPSSEKIPPEEPEQENLPEFTLRVRQLDDGSWEYYRYYYQPSDRAAPPKQGVAKRDISDPSTYLGMPDVDHVNDWQPSDAVPAVHEQAGNSDDGAEYDPQIDYPDTSGLGQRPVTIDSHAVDWDDEQQIQQQETSGYHSQHSTDYDRLYHTKAKPRHKYPSSKQKRRESFTAPPSQKLPFLPRFFFGEAAKPGKVRNGRVDAWLRDVPREFAEEIAQQIQYYTDYEEYQNAMGHR